LMRFVTVRRQIDHRDIVGHSPGRASCHRRDGDTPRSHADISSYPPSFGGDVDDGYRSSAPRAHVERLASGTGPPHGRCWWRR
jgi:hypothetical protein